jgi:hypothetical protein
MFMTRKTKASSLIKQSGQIVLEYVFLLMIGVLVAALITSMAVSRNPDSPGFLIVKWREMIQVIGSDSPEDLDQ